MAITPTFADGEDKLWDTVLQKVMIAELMKEVHDGVTCGYIAKTLSREQHF